MQSFVDAHETPVRPTPSTTGLLVLLQLAPAFLVAMALPVRKAVAPTTTQSVTDPHAAPLSAAGPVGTRVVQVAPPLAVTAVPLPTATHSSSDGQSMLARSVEAA